MNTAFLFFSKTGIVFELLALLFAFISYKKYSNTGMRIVLPYLIYIVSTEVFCRFIYHHHNQVFYNPVLIAEGLFYLYGFYTAFQLALFKKLAILFIVLFLLASVVNLIMLSSVSKELVSYSYSLGCLLIIALYLLYIYELSGTEINQRSNEQLFFWIANGIFIFLILRIIPEFILNNHTNTLSFNENAILKIIKYLGSDILYIFFIIGFIKCRSKVSFSS